MTLTGLTAALLMTRGSNGLERMVDPSVVHISSNDYPTLAMDWPPLLAALAPLPADEVGGGHQLADIVGDTAHQELESEAVMTRIEVAQAAPAASTGVISSFAYERTCIYFPTNCDYAYSVFMCESGMRPWAIGAAGEKGVAQIHPIHWARFGMPPDDLDGQLAQAAMIVAALGWGAWSCAS